MGKKKRPDHLADTRGGGWTGIPHTVMDSEAYRHLGMDARAILWEVARKFNGYNNGKIGIGYREIAERLNRKDMHFIAPAIVELIEHGFLDVAAAHSWADKRVREYRLTFVSTGAPGHHGNATNDYLRWNPAGSKRRRGARRQNSFSVGSVPTVKAASVGSVPTVIPETVGIVPTVVDGNPPFPPKPTVGTYPTLIDSHTPTRDSKVTAKPLNLSGDASPSDGGAEPIRRSAAPTTRASELLNTLDNLERRAVNGRRKAQPRSAAKSAPAFNEVA